MAERVLKFRAWDKQHKCMLPDDDLNFVIHPYDGTIYAAASAPNYPGDWEWNMDDDPTDNLMVMQYTGLNAEDNRGIYEGDIVRIIAFTGTDIRYIIVWDEWCWKAQAIRIQHTRIYFDVFNHQACKIIGNIYENPELLEKAA